MNRSLDATGTTQPLLAARLPGERHQLRRVAGGLAKRTYIVAWQVRPPVGVDALRTLTAAQ